MPNKTNQEWIQENNTKIDTIKAKVDALPEYQDIEPIYQTDSLLYRKLNFSKPNGLRHIEYLGNYLAVSTYVSYTYTYTIYKILDTGNLVSLVSYRSDSSYFWHYLVDYDDNYVYFYRNTSFNYQSNLTLYRVSVNGRYC